MMTEKPKISVAESAKFGIPEALAIFASAEASMAERRSALSILIGEKFLPKQADDPGVTAGRTHLLRLTQQAEAPQEQLQAIAECVRLCQVVKRWAADVVTDLQPAFTQELPPMNGLTEADDRLNLARACSVMSAAWLPAWLARAIAEEETGEKPRAELLAALLSRSASLSEAMQWLLTAFVTLEPLTESPGDTVARRLTRTLVVWREALRESELDGGQGLGVGLHELLALPLSNVGKPQVEKVQLDLCQEALLAVHDSVRTRISLAADPDVYKVVSYCKRLCGGRSWPKTLEKTVQRLVGDVSEALLLLGRQGQRDQALLMQLQVLTNTTDQARRVAQRLAEQHPELPEPVRDWLIYGRIRQIVTASASAEDAANSNADETLGLSLYAARQLRKVRDSLSAPLKEMLDIYEPTLLPATQDLLDRVQALVVLVNQAASLRRLELYGTPGEEVEVSPKFFDVIGKVPRQRMTVRQPAVVRLKSDQTVGEVVVRGLVE